MEITNREVDGLSAQEYQKRMQDPEFRAAVDNLNKQSVAPAAPEFDPVAEIAPVEPVAEVPTAPVVKEYRYQPTDEQGRKLGGEQVIKYTTEQELAEKLRDQNVLLVRKLREVTRRQYTGAAETEEVPASIQSFEGPIQLSARELSAEERFQIGQNIQDPTKFEEGRDQLLESAFGVKPEVLRNRINSMEQRLSQREALDNYTIFLSDEAGYVRNAENDQTLTAYMVKHGVPPTVAGFKYAHDKVKAAGLLLDTPPVHEVTVPVAQLATEPVVVNSQPPVATGTRIGSEEQPQTKRQVSVPSGLNDRVSSTSTPRSEGLSVTLSDIDNMPATQYKKWIQVPANRELVNRLEKEKLERSRAAMPQ